MSQNHLADGLIIFLLAGIYNEHKKRRREWGEDMEGKVVTEQLKSAISERKKKVVKADGKLE